MPFSLQSLTDLAKSPRGKQLVQQARRLDTPANRKKAMELFSKVRGQRSRKAGPR
jgi:hypothetical protein